MTSSYRLWNLWDMLEKYGVLVSSLTAYLSQHEQKLTADIIHEESRPFGSSLTARKLRIDDDDVTQANNYLPHVEKLIAELELESSAFPAERIRSALANRNYPKHLLAHNVGDLLNRLHDELSSRQFIFVSSRSAKYYKQIGLFGQEVSDCFPSAIDDIQDAGTALALGLGTSCVMHLMRVMEVGLKVLAKELEVPYAPSWDAYLTKIEQNISAKYSLKSAEWKQREALYREVSGDLLTIKQAWRNTAMHIDRRYSPEQAGEILSAVGTLMQRMAQNLTQKKQPTLTLIANNQVPENK